VFVRPAKAQPGDHGGLLPPSWLVISGGQDIVLAASPDSLLAAPHGLGLPVRLHLMHQVLLI
jgi:hypothetical protein